MVLVLLQIYHFFIITLIKSKYVLQIFDRNECFDQNNCAVTVLLYVLCFALSG